MARIASQRWWCTVDVDGTGTDFYFKWWSGHIAIDFRKGSSNRNFDKCDDFSKLVFLE